MEECKLLAEARESAKKEIREWRTRHSRNQITEKKKKGPVGPEKEEEEDKLERFFCQLYEFHNACQFHNPAPAELPPRYAIVFVPATTPVQPVIVSSSAVSSSVQPVVVSSSTASSSSSSDIPSSYSVVSSANFVFPASSTHCMSTT